MARVARRPFAFTAQLRRVGAAVIGTPAGLLLTVWSLAVVLFALGPVQYNEQPGLGTWLFVGGCLLLFCLGAWLAAAGRFRRHHLALPLQQSDPGRLATIVRVTAIVGLFGALCIAIDKLILSGLDFSQGVTALRFSRAQAVDAATASSLPRSPLLYLGYLTFSFSVASYLLSVLKGEALRRSTTLLAFASLAAPFSYSYIYGGRSPVFLVVSMAFGAMAVRLLSGRSLLPRGKMAPSLFVAFLALTFVYSNWIQSERFVATGASDYSDLEARFETAYDARIAPIAVAPPPTAVPSTIPVGPSPQSAQPSLYERALMHVVFNSYYLSHELPMLDRTLAYEGRLGPYYGAYQFYLVAAPAGRVFPSLNVDAIMGQQLRSANVYGWFSTAWGGMYLDFGVWGALVGALFCGWLARRVYDRALVTGDDAGQLLLCYVVAGIIATPILSIFTISISLLILISLIVTAFLLVPVRVWPTRAKLPSGATAQVR
jgi:hypothetical protein